MVQTVRHCIQNYSLLINLNVTRTAVDRPSHSRHLVKHSQESVSGSGSEGTAIPPQPNEEPGVTTTSPWYMRILAVFTTYGDLAVANTPEEFGLVHTRLQKEWTFEGSFVSLFAIIFVGSR